MITGGNATIYVSDMDRSVQFYTDTLGLKLQGRYGDYWAQIDAGGGMALGLHPTGPKSPKAGTSGSISVGLLVDGAIDQEVSKLTAKGVAFRGPVVNDGPVKLAFFGDPDGNDLYLCETDEN